MATATRTPRTTKPRRRRPLLGLPKKSTARKRRRPDPIGLTDEEFAASKSFKCAVVTDIEGDEHEFSVGDDVLVVPSGQDPSTAHLQLDIENWVAKIRKIAQHENGDVWARIEWYWSPQHVASAVKNFDPSGYATHELFPDEDTRGYIPMESIIDTVKVIQYDDCALDPPFIGPTAFFFRHTFRAGIKHVTSFLSREVCSICQQPYNPDAVQQRPEPLTMHFCPRDSCQTAWHRQCLAAHRTRKRPACDDRQLSLLCSIPAEVLKHSASHTPSISPPSLLSLLSTSNSASQPRSEAKKRKRASDPDPLSLLRELPKDLTELASQPIVKPTFRPSGVYRESPKRRSGKGKAPTKPENSIHNIAGNITTVLKARVLVNEAIRGAIALPRDWRKEIGWDDDTIPSIIVDSNENGSCPPLLCPTCGEHI